MTDFDVFSVQEINNHIKNILESNIPILYVEGEITNFIRHSSGHIYFSIKDDFSTLRCVFFRQNNYSLDFFPKNGDKIILLGNITLYVKGGSYQFNVQKMFSSGKGVLQIKFEQLKAKLDAEGLFSSEHKKPIPAFPQKVGVITSATGAALQDIKNVIFRRFPIELILYPASVQGDQAVPELIRAVKYFTVNPRVDVLIISRGGGSQEDLFCFNDEELVRAIFKCPIPVISGVGHEIDFSLTDFVSDLRAPTPSAAAELAVPDRTQLQDSLNRTKSELKLQTQSLLHLERNRINRVNQKFNDLRVESTLNQKRLELFDLEKRFSAIGSITDFLHQKLNTLADKLNYDFLSKANLTISQEKNRLVSYNTIMDNYLINNLSNEKHKIDLIKGRIEARSPLGILKQGFAYISKDDKLVSRAKNLQTKDKVNIRFYDGSVEAEVTSKK
jgi:exodeoxyribonuclease VII large subunit